MNIDYPTIDRPATPDFVLEVLIDSHRQQCEYDPEADSTINLSFNSTIQEWRSACDLVSSRELGRALNEIWETNLSDEQWDAVLTPAHEKTLSNVCELIAAHVAQPIVRPAQFFGGNCLSAGVFLTIRSLLYRAGADVSSIKPSTPIADYTRRHVALFLDAISRLAPGRLPPVRIRMPIFNAIAAIGVVVGIIVVVFGFSLELAVVSLIGGVLSVCCFVAISIYGRYLLPTSVDFGSIRTFRGLSHSIAEYQAEPK